MSADNWAPCPRCTVSNKQRLEKAFLTAASRQEKAYGNVTMDVYADLQKATEAAARELREAEERGFGSAETLREDYEIGILDGEFYVRYKGSCNTCDFRHEFAKDEAVS